MKGLSMRDVVICEPLRTPVGRFGGVFKDITPQSLAATVITALVERTGIEGSQIDDVILGQASPGGEARPSAGSRPSTPDSASTSPACRWIAAADPVCKPSSPQCFRWRPAATTSSSPVAPNP